MRATILLLVAAICWGLNFHFATYMLQETSFAEAAFCGEVLDLIRTQGPSRMKTDIFKIGIAFSLNYFGSGHPHA